MKLKHPRINFTSIGRMCSAFIFFIVAGCSHIPSAIDGEFPSISVAAARAGSEPQSVRWGGVIAKVSNQEQQSIIEIVAKPLGRSARPQESDTSGGRFLAVINDFIDPVIYEQGREITVVGQLSEAVSGKVGEMTYLFPVVQVSGHHLWQKRQEIQEVRYWGPSYWPIVPYHYHHHWHFRPGVGQPGSRPKKLPVKKK
ncbi:MAG: Slp family lipoprotein [Gammaproteobacteria bacterium]|nr:Slp family lipoprotein [Gammaproteobacteria bacterium]